MDKLLEYRQMTGKDSFEVNYQSFGVIPNIEVSIHDILKDLIDNNYLASQSKVIDLEGNILIYLTLDGIEYFQKSKSTEKNLQYIFNVSGGQVNIANDNAQVHATVNNVNKSLEADISKMKLEDFFIEFCNEDCFIYSANVPGNSLTIRNTDEINQDLELSVKYDMVPENDYSDKFAGYCIKNLPEDWRWLIENGCALNIEYETDNEVDMWVEIKTPLIELCKKVFSLSGKNTISINLGNYLKKREKWTEICEMCLVFRPSYDRSVESEVKITGIRFMRV